MTEKNTGILTFVFFVVIISMVVLGIGIMAQTNQEKTTNLEKFESEEDFQAFVSPNIGYGSEVPMPRVTVQASDETTIGGTSYSTKQTNVQVSGIDEPDIVKLSEDAAYYSPPTRKFFLMPTSATDVSIYPPRKPEDPDTRIISTGNTEVPDLKGEIEHGGKLLRHDNTLIIYNDSRISGYDITNSDNVSIQWSKNIPDNANIRTTRLKDGTVYFVVVNYGDSCPVTPVEGKSIDCEDIYYPSELKSGSGIYSVISMDANSGQVISDVTTVGSSRSSNIYMSENNIYLAFEYLNPQFNEFLNSEVESINDTHLMQIRDANISRIESRYEFRRVLQSELGTNKSDTSEKIYNEYIDYAEQNQRNLTRTSIVRINVQEQSVSADATGNIPGRTLNQYSFNEHDGNLRIATTVEEVGQSESVNDLYVLDENLEVRGTVTDMAPGQRVYAVRFIGDRGYVITFRQIDPLHVMDISNPDNPKEIGQLELPGFSDYLHKVGDGEILGIGESQNREAKLVLFNVSDGNNPEIKDSLILEDEYSTEVSEDFRSFLRDPDNGNLYLPAGNSVYVVSINNGDLQVVDEISMSSSAERVRVVGEELYAFHQDGVLSVDRETYQINKELEFRSSSKMK